MELCRCRPDSALCSTHRDLPGEGHRLHRNGSKPASGRPGGRGAGHAGGAGVVGQALRHVGLHDIHHPLWLPAARVPACGAIQHAGCRCGATTSRSMHALGHAAGTMLPGALTLFQTWPPSWLCRCSGLEAGWSCSLQGVCVALSVAGPEGCCQRPCGLPWASMLGAAACILLHVQPTPRTGHDGAWAATKRRRRAGAGGQHACLLHKSDARLGASSLQTGGARIASGIGTCAVVVGNGAGISPVLTLVPPAVPLDFQQSSTVSGLPPTPQYSWVCELHQYTRWQRRSVTRQSPTASPVRGRPPGRSASARCCPAFCPKVQTHSSHLLKL